MYFYIVLVVIALLLATLIVAVTICCVCVCGKKRKQWQPTVQPARNPVVSPVGLDQGGAATMGDTPSPMESFEIPAKKGVDEEYDDPTEMVEVSPESPGELQPPPKYDELGF